MIPKEFIDYIINRYNFVVLTPRVASKIEQLGVNSKVDMDLLLRCYVANEQKLNALQATNIARGNKYDGDRLFFYELQVILSAYPDFERTMAQSKYEEDALEEMRKMERVYRTIRVSNEKDIDSECNFTADEIKQIMDSD